MGKDITDTVEDYLKTVFRIEIDSGCDIVSLGILAGDLNLTPGTVTTMVKRFTKDGWLEYQPRKGCRLTGKGRRLAVKLLWKHRLIEFFLVETLGMQGTEVHEEAEVLEHTLSDEVLARLDRFLGHPEKDPHGKPIYRNIGDYTSFPQ